MKVGILYSNAEDGILFSYIDDTSNVTEAVDSLNKAAGEKGFIPWIKEVHTEPSAVKFLETNYNYYE